MEHRDESAVDRHVEKLENIWDRAKSQARGAVEWSRRISLVGKMKLDISKLQRARMNLYQDLGKRVHVLLKEGRFNPLELQELVDRVDQLNTRIATQARLMEETVKGPPRGEGGVSGHS